MVTEMNDLIGMLVKSIRAQVSDFGIIEEITEKLAQKKYRQVFVILYNLKEDGKWVLNDVDEKNLEAFWWEYAN
jgi:hypothetical protein